VGGLKLPEISLGPWHNFGGTAPLELSREIVRRAFELGITHFGLANNYGPPYPRHRQRDPRARRPEGPPQASAHPAADR
jgi:aryl-alcohol dehydrogenase-like predicted oxidoreductase